MGLVAVPSQAASSKSATEKSPGAVIDWIDIASLRKQAGVTDSEAVANGIAYDAERDRVFVTGKNWRKLFEIRVAAKPRG